MDTNEAEMMGRNRRRRPGRRGSKLKAVVGIDYELYSASFSGTGSGGSALTATSESQKFLTLNGGLYYMF